MRLPGPFAITRVVDLEGPFREPDFILPDAGPEAFAACAVARDPRFYDAGLNRLIMSFHTLIVDTGRSRIMVDTCVGNDKERPALEHWHRRNGTFLADLAAAGYPAESITHVFCTHLHADHVGWNTRLLNGRWVPTFPNARYIMHKAEVAHWENIRHNTPEPANQRSWDDSIQPVLDAGLAVMVDGTHEIEPGVRLAPAPGHTPGNCMLCLDDGKSRAFLIGDTVHHPVQIERPQWSSRFCSDPVQSAVTRRAFLEDVADSDAWVLPAHLAPPSAMRIVGARGGGFAFVVS